MSPDTDLSPDWKYDLFFVGLVKLHIITGTEYSNFTFTAKCEKNVMDGIVCIN